jgi:hypothetical protein
MNRPEAIVALGLVLVAGGLAALAIPGAVAMALVLSGLAMTVYGISKLRAGKEVWHTNESVGHGDGKTARFTTSTPFVAGTLSVFVDGIAEKPETEVPSTGYFTFDWEPAFGDHITASWKEA